MISAILYIICFSAIPSFFSNPVFNTLAFALVESDRLLKTTNPAPIANATAPMITKTYHGVPYALLS